MSESKTVEDQTAYDLLIDATAKDTERRIHEIMFLKDEIKMLIAAIRAAKDKKSLCAVADGTVERMRQRAYEEEQKRLPVLAKEIKERIAREQGHAE